MELTYIKGVSTLILDKEKCTNCGMCVTVCPHRVFTMQDGDVTASVPDKCMECGACMRNCPFSAVTVRAGVGCASAVFRGRKKTSGSAGCSCSCSCGDT